MFLVLAVEFTNNTHEVDVEEVDNYLHILVPVWSKNYDLILNLKLIMVKDHDFNIMHIKEGFDKKTVYLYIKETVYV